MAGLGAYTGNTPGELAALETWLGRPLDFVAAHTGQANWWDWENSISWIANQFKDVKGQLAWSIPLFANGGSLAEAAAGKYDSHYLIAAQKLLASADSSGPIYVRMGEEFNASWMTWSALGGKAGDFIKAYQEAVTVFRGVSDRFKFEWNVNVGDFGMNPADAYPGDKFVDIIGMDFYWNTQYQGTDPNAAWNWMVNQKYGLQWLEDFAKAHGKPTAYSEWGMNSNNGAAYIQKAYEWFESHNVVYQNYWDSNSGFAGKIDNGQYAASAAVYKDLFGDLPISSAPVVTTPVVTTPVVTAPVVTAPVVTAPVVTAPVVTAPVVTTPVVTTPVVTTPVVTTPVVTTPVVTTPVVTTPVVTTPVVTAPVVTAPVVTAPVTQTPAAPDLVTSSTSYTLAATSHNLTLIGFADANGTGNALDNVIIGNGGANHLYGKAGNDVLDGGKGADIMEGGTGDDTYYVDNRGDLVVEFAGEGHDTVISGMTYKLPDNVEDLILRYTGDAAGTGNALNNKIVGNDGNNILDGREGNDILDGGKGNDTLIGGTGDDRLTGGAGADTFKFGLWSGHDVITDFGTGGRDVIDISAWKNAGYVPTLTDGAAGITLTFRTGDSIQLLGVHAQDLHATSVGYIA